MNMLKQIPAAVLLLFFVGLTVSGPASFIAFWLGGRIIGGLTVLGFVLLFVGLYIHVMRRYG